MRYKLNALAFTFDHGFETDDAIANVRRAVAKLDIPFLVYRATFMHGMFALLQTVRPRWSAMSAPSGIWA